jgi:hypothetical protein
LIFLKTLLPVTTAFYSAGKFKQIADERRFIFDFSRAGGKNSVRGAMPIVSPELVPNLTPLAGTRF